MIKVQTGAIRLDDAYEPATRDLMFLYGYGTSLGAGGRELRLYRSPEYSGCSSAKRRAATTPCSSAP